MALQQQSEIYQKLKTWCLAMNAEHRLGFLQIDPQREQLSFCEHFFRNGDTDKSATISQSAASTAGAYENRLAGML